MPHMQQSSGCDHATQPVFTDTSPAAEQEPAPSRPPQVLASCTVLQKSVALRLGNRPWRVTGETGWHIAAQSDRAGAHHPPTCGRQEVAADCPHIHRELPHRLAGIQHVEHACAAAQRAYPRRVVHPPWRREGAEVVLRVSMA